MVFKFLHNNFNVLDLEKSLKFYEDALGLKEVRRKVAGDGSFILVYLFYFLTVVLQKKRINKFEKSNQVMYFVYKYKLDVKKINMRKFVQVISITNSSNKKPKTR